MSNRGSKRGPSLRRHKSTGHAYAKFNGQQVWFGHYDASGTHQSFAAYKAEWEANGREQPSEGLVADLTVADVVAAYLDHAEIYYRKPDGSPTHEIVNVRYTARPLLELFGPTPANDFDLRRLKLVRGRMVDAGLCRRTVNQRVTRVVRMLGWAVDDQLIRPEVYGNLRSLKPLKRGRSPAGETDPVRPVEWKYVGAILDRVPSPVRAMVLLQWHTGMRPGEVVQLRLADLDRSGPVWIYRPRRHKAEHHAKERIVGLGPKAQDVLRPYVMRVPGPDASEQVFSPREAVRELNAARRRGRQTPLWPSHERRNLAKRKVSPGRQPGDSYDVAAYRQAIRRACDACGIPPWTPNQLRHAAATRLRRELGIEAARVVLGHSSAAVTEVYAEADRLKALETMAEHG